MKTKWQKFTCGQSIGCESGLVSHDCSRQRSYFLKWAMGEISGFLKENGEDHICILERF